MVPHRHQSSWPVLKRSGAPNYVHHECAGHWFQDNVVMGSRASVTNQGAAQHVTTEKDLQASSGRSEAVVDTPHSPAGASNPPPAAFRSHHCPVTGTPPPLLTVTTCLHRRHTCAPWYRGPRVAITRLRVCTAVADPLRDPGRPGPEFPAPLDGPAALGPVTLCHVATFLSIWAAGVATQ